MLHNPSIETTKEMKRMLFLLKSLSSLLSSLTSSRVLFSLPLFSFARPSEIGFSSRLSYSTLLVVGFAFMPIPFLSGASSSLRAFSLSFSLSSSWKSCLLLLLLPSSARGRHLIRRGGKQPRGGFRSRRRCPPPVMRSKRETNNEDKNNKISVITHINSV